MKSLRIYLCFFLALGLLAACQPASTRTDPAVTVPVVFTLTPNQPATPTPTSPTPSPLPSDTPTPTITPSPRPVDMSQAVLRLEDLPDGFEVLDDASMTQLGLKPDLLAQLFEGTFHEAKPVTSFAFHNTKGKTFEIVIGTVFYPLTSVEQTRLDRILADPNAVMNNFTQGFNGQAQLNPNLSKVGDRSVGWWFTSASGQTTLKGEMVEFRRADAAGLMMTLGLADQTPPAPIQTLASLFDQRILKGLGY